MSDATAILQRLVNAAKRALAEAVQAAADNNGFVTFRTVLGVVDRMPWANAAQVIARGDAELV